MLVLKSTTHRAFGFYVPAVKAGTSPCAPWTGLRSRELETGVVLSGDMTARIANDQPLSAS